MQLQEQLGALLFMVCLGVAGSILADWNRALAMSCHWKRRQIAISDFCFCMFCGLSFWLILMYLNGGIFRNYILLGLAIGVFLYFRYWHTKLFPLWFRCIRRLVWVMAHLYRFVSRVLRFPFRMVYKWWIGPIRKRAIQYWVRRKREKSEDLESLE